MAKELPFFKFEPNQWENGNIQMCSDIAKAHFINVCCSYWSRTGSLSEKLAIIKCCGGNNSSFQELVDNEIVKTANGNVIISFLDSQLSEFMDIKKARAESGKKGGVNGAIRPEIERVQGNQLYVLLCSGNGEEFIKIGTTSNCVSRRYSGKMPYEYKVIFQVLTNDYLTLESEYCELFAKYQYYPKLNFQGQKECYDIAFFSEITGILEQRHNIAIAPLKRSETIRGEKRREEKRREETPKGVVGDKTKKVDFFLEVKNVGGDIYTDEMLKRFSEYWTEPIVKGKDTGKEKWQGEKTWKLTQRLSKWAERNLDGIVCYREDDKSIKDKKIAFKTELKQYLEVYGKDMINAFFLHWTQPENVKHPKKLKWELEDSWELKSRLISWKAREDARQDPAKKEEKFRIAPNIVVNG
jgi:hypothetical protein